MQISDFLSPVPTSVFDAIGNTSVKSLVNIIDIHTGKVPELSGAHIALIGVKDDRWNDLGAGSRITPDHIRTQLYKLIKHKYDIRLVDLGNIEAGNTFNDTLFALNACLKELHEQRIVTVILGGISDLAYGQFTSYQGVNHNLNVLVVDAKIDLKEHEQDPARANYLYKMITHQPNYLFNITHVGNQAYFVEQESIDAFDRMNFDMFRLGQVRANIQETEPLARNADMVVFSMNSIKAADVSASVEMNPNGLYGEEACQIARYAGMGNDVSSFGLFDLNASKDKSQCGSALAAQMLWYFIDGYYNRKNDYPTKESKDYLIYRTTFKNAEYEIVFYKNIYNERWWMEVPYPKEKTKEKKFLIVG
ncbi:MAG: formimidoylglutamase [Bacteroidia bacterium]|nr:formimidoylglutamase [Bacteroidia bacterium]